MVLLSLRNLNVRRLRKYCYRFEGTCKRMQGVNVPIVVRLLLTMFNSSELDKHTKEEWGTIKNNQLYNMCLISPYLVNADNIISNYYS